MTPPRPLPALTIHQPWAELIAASEKPVENRDWNPPRQLLGGYLAIHAGKKVDEAAYRFLQGDLGGRPRPALWTGRTKLELPQPHELTLGAVVAVARLAGAILTEGAADGAQLRIRRVLQPASGTQLAQERAEELACNRYAFGPWLWVLEEVVRLSVPIPCRGAQRIWVVPEFEADLVRAAWRTATNKRSDAT